MENLNKEKRWSGSRKFARDIMLVMLAFALLTAGTVFYLVMQVRRDISERYILDATTLAAAEFRSMRTSVEGLLTTVRAYGKEGMISLSDPEQTGKQLCPLFKNEPLLSGMIVADEQGRSYFIQPDGSERLPSEVGDFDPASRPWFKPVLDTDGIYWTEQYLFHTLKQVGVSASVSFSPPDSKTRMVVAVDLLLTDLYRQVKAMAPSENSHAIIFRHDTLLLLPESDGQVSEFVPFGSATNAIANSAHEFWKQGRGADEEVFSFLHQGKVWWCGFKPLNDLNQNVWIGVIVPESDIVRSVGRRRAQLLLFGTVPVLVLLAGGIWLVQRYRRILSDTRSSLFENTEEEILALIDKGENRYLEFKSTIRMNLHSRKPGKEIELAWLKGVAAFLNTDGGTLLLGVTDAGEVTGIERDVFENEDKCRLHFKNLIANHIGAELSKYIRFSLVPVAGKTVGVVHCSRASEPVFLKDGKKEYFYIRNGPSSDELPVSKALKYIKNRR